MTTLIDKTIRPIIRTIHDNGKAIVQIVVDYPLVCWIIGFILLVAASIISVYAVDKDNMLPIFFIVPTILYVVASLVHFFDPYR